MVSISLRIKGEKIVAEGDISALKKRGFGDESNGDFLLNPYEALYLMEERGIPIKQGKKALSSFDFMKLAQRAMEGFDILYLAYRDLRKRGYVVRDARPHAHFKVYERGKKPGKAVARYWLMVSGEHDVFCPRKIMEYIISAYNARKLPIYALIDDEGDVVYYGLGVKSPRGPFSKPKNDNEQPIPARIQPTRVVCPIERSYHLHESRFFGKPCGNTLILSHHEALYLKECGIIDLFSPKSNRKVGEEYLRRVARKYDKMFEHKYRVYRDLTNRGLILKTGLKYGTHFRAYDEHPDIAHARYLVHTLIINECEEWFKISRAVRLAHGVRKEILLAIVHGRGIKYIFAKRLRP